MNLVTASDLCDPRSGSATDQHLSWQAVSLFAQGHFSREESVHHCTHVHTKNALTVDLCFMCM